MPRFARAGLHALSAPLRLLSERHGRRVASLALSALARVAPALALGPAALAAQDTWQVEGEIAASLFFGNTDQATVSVRSGVAHADSLREVGLGGSFTYGEATDPESGLDFVTRRSWTADASYDHRPLERWSPFLFGRIERSLEKRLNLRVEWGIGAKYTVVRSEQGQLDLSVGVLGERTDARGVPVGIEDPEVRARWSVRLRARRELAGGRVSFNSETFWRPQLDNAGVATASTTHSLAAQLTERVSLKLTLVDHYDSGAMERGARSNNDGQLLLGVLTAL